MTDPAFLQEAGLIQLDDELSAKVRRFESFIQQYSRVLIAFSGGCDSALVAKASRDLLSQANVMAVTARSPSLPQDEIQEVERFVQTYEIRHQWIVTEELKNPLYARNETDRCYYCKTELYQNLSFLARLWRADAILNGINLDDLGDWRPGIKSAKEFNIQSPLVEAGLDKNDVRVYSKMLGLFTWDKPAAACLSSRFAYGEEISEEWLQVIDRGENIIREYGFRVIRLRKMAPDHGRIEVGADELGRLMEHPQKEMILQKIAELGFKKVDIDPEGYVQGKMNRV